MHPARKRLLEKAAPSAAAFERGCAHFCATQERFLLETLAANADTDIGRRCDFPSISSSAAYCERAPAVGLEDIEAELAAWRAGSRSLCAEPVVLTEWTSGTMRAAKPIPYSAAGLDDFRNALFAWLSSLCEEDPAVADGRAYWALSPAGTSAFADRSAANDAAYFGKDAPLLSALSAVPLALADLRSVEHWRFWTALFLAVCEDLCFLSVWSPCFLHPLLDTLEKGSDRIADAMRHPERHGVPSGLAVAMRKVRARSNRHVERLLAGTTAEGHIDVSVLWPGLRRISCWTHGAAASQIPGLARRFPGVTVEPKGLLSTEAAMSIPIHSVPDPVAAVTSGFLELQLDDGRCLPLGTCREGDEGRIRVTTRSGLWRYDTGDRVRATAFWKTAPCLLFLGREGGVVDLCGEKLDEGLVQTRLPRGLDAFQAPDESGRGYCLFLDAAQVTRKRASKIAAHLDAALCEILHYRHARQLGQLDAVRPIRVTRLLASAAERRRETHGIPLATIKIPALDADRGWLAYFTHSGVLSAR